MDSPDAHVEAISFDLDGTLVQYERSPGEVLQAAFDALDVDPLFGVEKYYARYDEFAESSDSMDELRSDCFATLAAENGHDSELGRAVARAFSDERDQSNVELLQGARPVLNNLSREYQLAIVTNGARDAQRAKIEAVDLERWVDSVVIAGADSPPKPSVEPFDIVVDALDTAHESMVHVGDSLETDIAGAAGAGMDSVWVSGAEETGEFEPTYRVADIGNFLPVPWAETGPTDS